MDSSLALKELVSMNKAYYCDVGRNIYSPFPAIKINRIY